MSFCKATAVLILALAQVMGAGAAFAGFDFSTTGQAEQSAESIAPVSISETKAPALQVFQDKYVPDSIRKKYNLKDDWYGNGNQPSLPQMIAPEPIDPIVDDGISSTVTPIYQEGMQQAPVIVDTWRARKGENLRDVLQRWSTRGETNLMWASPDTPLLPKDFSFVGKYQDAVNALIKEAGGDNIHSQYRGEGMKPTMMTPASTVTTNAPAPLPSNIAVVPEPRNIFSKVFQPEVKSERKPETRWFGLSGAPLVEVIQVWADDAGVEVIWQSEKNFAVKNSISQVGQFEDAVFQALSQYDNEPIRPVGEMYNDPKTGRQVLVVRTDIAKE